jgi:hypothetical protein
MFFSTSQMSNPIDWSNKLVNSLNVHVSLLQSEIKAYKMLLYIYIIEHLYDNWNENKKFKIKIKLFTFDFLETL